MTKEYATLFNAVSEALEALEAVQMKLMAAQYNAEEDYISQPQDGQNKSITLE